MAWPVLRILGQTLLALALLQARSAAQSLILPQQLPPSEAIGPVLDPLVTPSYPLTPVPLPFSYAQESIRLEPGVWDWELLPAELIYPQYLAGLKEPRLSTVYFYETEADEWLWDSTLGGRVGLLRYGSFAHVRPDGWQLDLEGAVFVRLEPEEDQDLRSADYRVGIPLTLGLGRWQGKLGYYHMSSHVGDEFLLKNPGFERLNYSRDVLVLGSSYYVTDDVRVYGEVGWAFYTGSPAEPWEFQFGAEYRPAYRPGTWHAPFLAVNAHLRQEVDFDGHFVAQAGWMFWGRPAGPLLRTGLQYLRGKSPQMEFFDRSEEQIGAGLWYDY